MYTKEIIEKDFFPNGIIQNYETKFGNIYFDVFMKNSIYTNFSDGLEITHVNFQDSTISFFIDKNTKLKSK